MKRLWHAFMMPSPFQGASLSYDILCVIYRVCHIYGLIIPQTCSAVSSQ